MDAMTPAVTPRYLEIADYLRRLIAASRPGDRLPSEAELLRALRGQPTVRRAVQLLANEPARPAPRRGHVHRPPRRGPAPGVPALVHREHAPTRVAGLLADAPRRLDRPEPRRSRRAPPPRRQPGRRRRATAPRRRSPDGDRACRRPADLRRHPRGRPGRWLPARRLRAPRPDPDAGPGARVRTSGHRHRAQPARPRSRRRGAERAAHDRRQDGIPHRATRPCAPRNATSSGRAPARRPRGVDEPPSRPDRRDQPQGGDPQRSDADGAVRLSSRRHGPDPGRTRTGRRRGHGRGRPGRDRARADRHDHRRPWPVRRETASSPLPEPGAWTGCPAQRRPRARGGRSRCSATSPGRTPSRSRGWAPGGAPARWRS
jgi:hypothetical protein